MRWLALLALLFTVEAQAALLPFKVTVASAFGACTDGVDCYCDTVSDPDLILCEDFESPDYYENTSNDWATAPGGQPGYRGGASRWLANYNSSGGKVSWTNGNPASPQVGSTCTEGTCGPKEYCSDSQSLVVLGTAGSDCWDGNDGSGIDIQRDDDFNDELGTLTLTGGNSGGGDVFSGNAHMAYRVEEATQNEIIGSETWTDTPEFGLTMAVAYSSNLASVSLADDAWKHEEFGDYPYSENFHMGNTGYADGLSSTFPFNPFMFGVSSGYSEAACDAALASADRLVGNFNCNSAGLEGGATNGTGTNEYDQSTDWPFGTWGCVQAYLNGMGTSDMEWKIWFNGELIIHLDNFDAATHLYNTGYDEFYWNAYANANQDPDCNTTCEDVTTDDAYRYVDNVHFRAGAPVSCASIGF